MKGLGLGGAYWEGHSRRRNKRYEGLQGESRARLGSGSSGAWQGLREWNDKGRDVRERQAGWRRYRTKHFIFPFVLMPGLRAQRLGGPQLRQAPHGEEVHQVPGAWHSGHQRCSGADGKGRRGKSVPTQRPQSLDPPSWWMRNKGPESIRVSEQPRACSSPPCFLPSREFPLPVWGLLGG